MLAPLRTESPLSCDPPTQGADPAVPKIFQGKLKGIYPLYRSFELWSDAGGMRMSAAMSFYGILSLAPLLVIIVAAVGWWLDRETLVVGLTEQIGQVVGARGAEVVRAALDSARQPQQGIFASILAFGLLLMGATGVFAELQSAFERLWTQGSGVAPKGAWWYTATLRLRGVAYVLAIGFLMLVSLVISSMLTMLEQWGGQRVGLQALLAVLNQAVSLIVISGLFVALMRMSAGPQPRLRHLVVGSVVGAVLFGLGKYALALYLSTAAVVSAYGAAGSLVVLLMWIYFASAVLLYAASCARVLAEQCGEFSSGVSPATVETDQPAEPNSVNQLGRLAEIVGATETVADVASGRHEAFAHLRTSLWADSADSSDSRDGAVEAREPTFDVTKQTVALAAGTAVAAYLLAKRLGSGNSSGPSESWPIQQPERRNIPPPAPSQSPASRRMSRGISMASAGVVGATSLARRLPINWTAWGVTALKAASKWRQRQHDHELDRTVQALEADIRALRRRQRRHRS